MTFFFQDFGISGLRVGAIHTWNKHITESIKKLCYFAGVPVIVQSRVEMFLKDKGKYNFQTLLISEKLFIVNFNFYGYVVNWKPGKTHRLTFRYSLESEVIVHKHIIPVFIENAQHDLLLLYHERLIIHIIPESHILSSIREAGVYVLTPSTTQ